MGLGFFNRTKTAAIVVALTAILAVGCGGNGDSDEMNRLVPEGSTLIGDIDLAAVLADLDLELLFDALPVGEDGLASFRDLFEGAQLETGIEFRDVTNVEFFGDAAESSEYFGVVVYGEFDETAVVAQISANGDGPLVSDAYKGYDIHTPQNDPDSFTLSVLDSGTLALGTDRALKDIIDVQAGDREAASGRLVKLLDDFGERLFGVVIEGPAGALSDYSPDAGSLLGGGGGILEDLPLSLDFLDSIEMVGVAGSLRGENIGLTAVLDFENEGAAELTQLFLGGLLSVASSLVPDSEIRETWAGLEVLQEGARLTLSVELPENSLIGLLDDLTTITDSTTSPELPTPAN